MATYARATLLGLPDEILAHTLSYCDPSILAITARTCRRLLQLSYDDLIWQPIVNGNLSKPVLRPASLKSFRELYIAHHPHWFLIRHRLWFADTERMGKLLLTFYEPTTGSIEAYAVTATCRQGLVDWVPWEKDQNVRIISFDPQVSLDLHQPVVKLDIDSQPTQDGTKLSLGDLEDVSSTAYINEILMETFQEAGLFASFILCRALPEVAITENTQVWPPLRFPAESRTRNLSSDEYVSEGHRPRRLADVSQNNFRLRKWIEYVDRRAANRSGNSLASRRQSVGSNHHNTANINTTTHTNMPLYAGGFRSNFMGRQLRMPEDITTYATIPESSYMPTAQKPWQGLWCGDYSGHGCEFLIIRQLDEDEAEPLPSGMDYLQPWFAQGRRDTQAGLQQDRRLSTGSDSSFVSAQEEASTETPTETQMYPDSYTDIRDPPTGRLEGIKLTGDANIPRGEYTFIAPDIGHGGFMRVADEEIFRGARVVRSAGHIAGRGFIEDQYTPSQLIMISHNRLAQYWEGFEHISYFQRVDLGKLLESRPSILRQIGEVRDVPIIAGG